MALARVVMETRLVARELMAADLDAVGPSQLVSPTGHFWLSELAPDFLRTSGEPDFPSCFLLSTCNSLCTVEQVTNDFLSCSHRFCHSEFQSIPERSEGTREGDGKVLKYSKSQLAASG